MADPREALREKQARLLKEAEEAEKQAQELAHDIKELDRILAKHHLKLAQTSSAADAASTRRPNEPDPLSQTGRARSAAEQVIRAAGRPVPLAELYEKVKEKGVEIGGKRPTTTFGGYVSHSKRFVLIQRRGWWLAGEPVPEGDARVWSPPSAHPEELGPKSMRIARAVESFLMQEKRRATSGELAKMLVAQGIDLGEHPGKLLSAYLARSQRFDNDAAHGGYGLIEWSQTPNTDGDDDELLERAKKLAWREPETSGSNG